MITMLKNNKDGTYNVVSDTAVKPGDQFVAGYGIKGDVLKVVTVKVIIEQRKGKGTYVNESLRPFWAKVS